MKNNKARKDFWKVALGDNSKVSTLAKVYIEELVDKNHTLQVTNQKLFDVVQDFADTLDVLAMRPGVTVNEVADLMNPIGDTARVIIEDLTKEEIE